MLFRCASASSIVVASVVFGSISGAHAAPQFGNCDANQDGYLDFADLAIIAAGGQTYQYEITGAPNSVAWNWNIDAECNGPPLATVASGSCISIGPPFTALQVATDFAACINAASPSPLILKAWAAPAFGKAWLIIDIGTPLPNDTVELCISGGNPNCCPVPVSPACSFNPSIRLIPAAERCNWACRSDFNHSGAVDGDDLGAMLGEWGGSSPCFDYDGNGNVDGNDLGSLLGEWGPCP